MRLASGIVRAVELEDAGVTIGLGVDGSASNDASNLIREVRQALYLQRLRYGADIVTCDRVLDWATTGSAAALGRDDIGAIERSEEHTSELQSRGHLVCRLLLEKKKTRADKRADCAHSGKGQVR